MLRSERIRVGPVQFEAVALTVRSEVRRASYPCDTASSALHGLSVRAFVHFFQRATLLGIHVALFGSAHRTRCSRAQRGETWLSGFQLKCVGRRGQAGGGAVFDL